MATTKSDYIFALLREIEQRFPSSGITNHAITWDSVDGTGEVLVLLVNVGDCMWPHRINPRDLYDDPAETAAWLVSQFTDGIGMEPEKLITFKR